MADEQQPQAPEAQPETDPKAPANTEGSSDSWMNTLPEQAQTYIKELRGENASRRTENRDIKKQLEQIQSAQTEAETAKLAEQQKWQELYEKEKAEREKLAQTVEAERLNNVKLRIASEHKLPAQLAARLVGDDEDSLRADAAELAKLIPSGTAPADEQITARSRQTTSAVPDGQPTRETDDQRRARLNPRLKSPTIFDAVDIIVHDD
jgi:hypothetical protein